MAKLLVRAALPHLNKAELFQSRDNSLRLQYWELSHDLADLERLDADKFGLQLRLAIFQ